MRMIYLFFLNLCLFILINNTIAQKPQPFAAGEIVINSIADSTETCGTKHRYEVILKFYYDCIPDSFSLDSPLIYFYNPAIVSLNSNTPNGPGFFSSVATELEDRGTIENLCVNDSLICTKGKWYRTEVLLEESDTRWQIRHGEMQEIAFNPSPPRRTIIGIGNLIHSRENLNIDQGQRYSLRSEILVQCTKVYVDSIGSSSNVELINTTYANSTGHLIPEDLLETYCDRQEYEYNLAIQDNDHLPLDINLDGKTWIDVDNDSIFTPGTDIEERVGPDSLVFQLTSPFGGNGGSVFYTFPYSGGSPLPVKTGTKVNLTADGFLSFQPNLLPSESSFVGVVSLKVSEYRKQFFIESIDNGMGGKKDTIILKYGTEPIAVSYRQFRYVIDKDCNKQLPNFFRDSSDWNSTEKAWEFDCAMKEFTFKMDKPMYVRSLNRLDFRIFRGSFDTIMDNSSYVIEKIEAINQTPREMALGEFSEFRITTSRTMGPGNYIIFTKLGSDGNTLINRCGFQLPERTVIPIYINDHFEYNYPDGGNPINICYPKTDIEFFPLAGQSNLGLGEEFKFTFTYSENTSPPPYDTTFYAFYRDTLSPFNSYREKIKLDPTTNSPILKEGKWTIGFGHVYRYHFNGQTFRQECYDEDEVLLKISQSPDTSDCSPPSIDIELRNLDVQDTLVLKQAVDIKGNVTNVGKSEVNWFEVSWAVNDGMVFKDTVSEITIQKDSSYTFNHTKQFVPENISNANILKVWVSNVNRTNISNHEKDTLSKVFEVVVGIDEIADVVKYMKLYPNPTQEHINIDLSLLQSNHLEVELLDIRGKLLDYKNYGKINQGSQSFRFDLPDLSNGIYFVTLKVANERLYRKIVVNK